jgi:site-specific DNA-cytosine methylase
MKEINVLSLFDGKGCGLLALNSAQIPVANYFASEIDKPAMTVAKHNFPHINHVGDICNINPDDYKNIDLIIGGSPCQSISAAGKLKGITTNDGQVIDSLVKYLLLKDMGYSYDKSSLKYFNASCLFWEYVRVYQGIKKHNPEVKFLLENVVNKFWGLLISNEMGVNPIKINSSTVSAQNRNRYYWTNITYLPISNRKLTLDSVIPNAVCGVGTRGVPQKNWKYSKKNPFLHIQKTTVRKDYLANCLTASGGELTRKYMDINGEIHIINIEQAEQLQTVPIGYTNVPGVSQYQRFKMLGNGWTVEVIAHFFKCMKIEIETIEDLTHYLKFIDFITE